ncbi:hypothetical protein ACJX0J_024610, partial [Zea mays]
NDNSIPNSDQLPFIHTINLDGNTNCYGQIMRKEIVLLIICLNVYISKYITKNMYIEREREYV